MSDQIHYYYECQCHSDEHRIIWWMDDGRDIDWEPMLGFSVFLPDYPKFWSRIWNAIKYIFGYKSKYGHFDSFLMKPEDIDNMVSMLLNFKEEPAGNRENLEIVSSPL